MSVSVDGFIADRAGEFGWTVPNEEQFRFHTVQTRELGAFLCGRRLYETMLVWETDPSMRDNELDHHNVVSIEIRGTLWAHPLPIELLLRTDLDLETGEVRIHDLGAAGTR